MKMIYESTQYHGAIVEKMHSVGLIRATFVTGWDHSFQGQKSVGENRQKSPIHHAGFCCDASARARSSRSPITAPRPAPSKGAGEQCRRRRSVSPSNGARGAVGLSRRKHSFPIPIFHSLARSLFRSSRSRRQKEEEQEKAKHLKLLNI